MRITELFSKKSAGYGSDDIDRLSNLGAVSFGRGVTDKNEERTPHYEINRCLEMLETNPLVSSAVDQLTLFLIPNKRIKIFSKDSATRKFLEDWHEQRKNILEEMRNIIITNVTCGNGPMEKHHEKLSDGRWVLDNVFSNNDMTRIYVNPDDLHGDEAFIYELPVGIKLFRYMGEEQRPTFRKITYIKNYVWTRKRVWSIAIPAWKFAIYKSGWSRDNLYGRSQLASGIDADNVFREILSSWDTIARTRQIDQKILTVADTETAMQVDQKVLDDLGDELEDSDKSYTLFNFPLQLLQQDIRTSQGYDLMENVFDMVRRMLMMSLLPQHLTPWSDSATTQGAESAMPAFLGRVKAKQNEFIHFFNENIIGELRKTYPWLAEDATYVFDEPKVLADETYIRMIGDMVDRGMIDARQGQEMIGRLGIVDEDILQMRNQEGNSSVVGSDPFNLEKSNTKHSFKERAVKLNVTFATFKRRLKQDEPNVDTSGWEEILSDTVGGHDVRLVKHDNDVMIFDGLRLQDQYDLNTVTLGFARKAYGEYKDKLRKSFDEFEEEETPEDDAIEDARIKLKDELSNRLNKIFKAIDRRSRKTEAFTSDKVLGDVDGALKGFTSDLNKLMSNTMKKLEVQVVDGEGDNVEPTKKVKDRTRERRKLLQKNIQDQIKTTSQKMLADIKGAITRGIAAGKSNEDLKREIEAQFNYEDGVGWKFDRILRTDTRQASGIMKLRKWKDMGFEKFVWVTRGDRKVRPALDLPAKTRAKLKGTHNDHRSKNKKVFSIDDALAGKTIFPGGSIVSGKPNINCRCRMLPYS